MKASLVPRSKIKLRLELRKVSTVSSSGQRCWANDKGRFEKVWGHLSRSLPKMRMRHATYVWQCATMCLHEKSQPLWRVGDITNYGACSEWCWKWITPSEFRSLLSCWVEKEKLDNTVPRQQNKGGLRASGLDAKRDFVVLYTKRTLALRPISSDRSCWERVRDSRAVTSSLCHIRSVLYYSPKEVSAVAELKPGIKQGKLFLNILQKESRTASCMQCTTL